MMFSVTSTSISLNRLILFILLSYFKTKKKKNRLSIMLSIINHVNSNYENVSVLIKKKKKKGIL